MNSGNQNLRRNRSRAFTLIELLVVIAIIAALAAMIFPATMAAKRAQIRNKALGQMKQIEMAIENYKTKQGYYPPDNNYASGTARLTDPINNFLYYELLGTKLITPPGGGTAYFETLDGSARVNNQLADFKAAFGPNTEVIGFANANKGGDEGGTSQRFLKGNLKSDQFGTPAAAGQPTGPFLGSSLEGPGMVVTKSGKLNPWRYVSSNPTNNPRTYDLWIDVVVGSKTNRFCNWSDQILTLN